MLDKLERLEKLAREFIEDDLLSSVPIEPAEILLLTRVIKAQRDALTAISQDGWIEGAKQHGPYKGDTAEQIAASSLATTSALLGEKETQ